MAIDLQSALDALPRFPDRATLDALRTTALEQRLGDLPAAERAREAQRWQDIESRAVSLSACSVPMERRHERPCGVVCFTSGLRRLSAAFGEPEIPEADVALLYLSDGDDASRAWWAFHPHRAMPER